MDRKVEYKNVNYDQPIVDPQYAQMLHKQMLYQQQQLEYLKSGRIKSLPKNKFNKDMLAGQYVSDPEVLDKLVKTKQIDDDQYLSYSEASDNEYEYFVCKVKKNQQKKDNEIKANKFEGPLKNISEKSDSE